MIVEKFSYGFTFYRIVSRRYPRCDIERRDVETADARAQTASRGMRQLGSSLSHGSRTQSDLTLASLNETNVGGAVGLPQMASIVLGASSSSHATLSTTYPPGLTGKALVATVMLLPPLFGLFM
jgi:hypothetical protein